MTLHGIPAITMQLLISSKNNKKIGSQLILNPTQAINFFNQNSTQALNFAKTNIGMYQSTELDNLNRKFQNH